MLLVNASASLNIFCLAKRFPFQTVALKRTAFSAHDKSTLSSRWQLFLLLNIFKHSRFKKKVVCWMQLDKVIRIAFNTSSFPYKHEKCGSTGSTFISVVFYGKEPLLKALLKDNRRRKDKRLPFPYVYAYICISSFQA